MSISVLYNQCMINVYTVLNVSFNHTKEYVYRLKQSLEKNSTISFNFYCLTNEQLPGINTIPIKGFGRWSKIEICNPSIEGKIVYLDIDTVIIGNIDFLFQETKEFMCKGLDGKRRSQILSLDQKNRMDVWDFWCKRSKSIVQNFKGEGAVYDFIVSPEVLNIQDLHPGKVIDFSEASEFLSIGSKIVTFSNGSYPNNLEGNNYIKQYW